MFCSIEFLGECVCTVTIESVGILEPMVILRCAIRVLRAKCEALLAEIDDEAVMEATATKDDATADAAADSSATAADGDSDAAAAKTKTKSKKGKARAKK
jgi:hypothetical protein